MTRSSAIRAALIPALLFAMGLLVAGPAGAGTCSPAAMETVGGIEAAFDGGRIGEAMALAEGLVAREPGCAQGHAWLGLLQLTAPTSMPSVEYHLGCAFTLAPDDCTVLTLIAMARQADLDLGGAGRWSSRASDEGCASPWLAIVESSMDIAMGRPEQAHERLTRWHEAAPGSPLVSGMLAVTTFKFKGELATANLMDGVSRGDTTNFLTHLVCAQVYSQLLDDEARTAAEIDRAVELLPQERVATWYAARYLVQLGYDARASHLLSSRSALFEGGPPQSYWMGYAYLRAQRFDDALGALEDAMREAPRDPMVVTGLVELYGMAEGYPRLVSYLREVADADTSAQAADVVLAYSYLSDHDDEAALRHARRAARRETLSYLPLQALGESYMRLGRIDDATRAYKHAVRLAPLNSGVYGDLGEAYRRSERYGDALLLFQEYARIDPADPWAHHNVSVSYLDLGLYPEAEAESRMAVELDPDNAVARGNLGAALLAQEQYEEAMASFDEALRLDPGDVMTLANRGTAAFYVGDFELAVRSYEEAVDGGLSDPELMAHLGDSYFSVGRLEDAYGAYKKASRGDPGNANLHALVGNACELTGRYEEAVQEHLKAVSIEPGTPELHYNLGVAYVNTGSFSLAEQQYLAELKINPDHAKAHNNLAAIYREQRRYFRSIEEARRALELDPHYPEAYINLGLSLAMVGKVEESLETLRHGTEMAPDAPRVWYTLGHICLATGDTSCARDVLEPLRALEPALAEQLAGAIEDAGR